ncbi:MAG: hypothetical protein AVDCRST_MAG77-2973 [uncultured Chloroflexi bacterium]|uniref:Uncharacterized protein n=1 Tax=uncultured Chloroflexota bacterium TaxID=166587 RepID=A0A6J4IDD4_9CHLR|nr:MAG: hypothetical protein AVDCRST_MAG77-2973 [uncultured Chloroflexota bacterium]
MASNAYVFMTRWWMGLPVVLTAGAISGYALMRLRERRPTQRPRPFDPDRIAYFEAAGWRAYYDRDWLRLVRLLAQACREQFRMPFPRNWLGAYYVTRAAAAWAPKRNKPQEAHQFYERFYALAKRYSGMAFDPARVAALELRYNDVHRRLSGMADTGEFIDTMTALHGALFGLSPEAALESAEQRVLAAHVVDRITGKRSEDVEADWRLLEEHLRACYRSVQRALTAGSTQSTMSTGTTGTT